MKKFRKNYLLLVVAAAAFSGLMTSCDPDDVEDFAAGYRYGYESTRTTVDTPAEQANQVSE